MMKATASFHALVSGIEHLAMNETRAMPCLSPSASLLWRVEFCETVAAVNRKENEYALCGVAEFRPPARF